MWLAPTHTDTKRTNYQLNALGYNMGSVLVWWLPRLNLWLGSAVWNVLMRRPGVVALVVQMEFLVIRGVFHRCLLCHVMEPHVPLGTGVARQSKRERKRNGGNGGVKIRHENNFLILKMKWIM